jgi:hypothetical protein
MVASPGCNTAENGKHKQEKIAEDNSGPSADDSDEDAPQQQGCSSYGYAWAGPGVSLDGANLDPSLLSVFVNGESSYVDDWPDSYNGPVQYVPGENGEIGQWAPDWRALLQQALATVAQGMDDAFGGNVFSADCQRDLLALGVTPSQVQQGAENAQLLDGSSSAIPVAMLYMNAGAQLFNAALAQYGTTTIGTAMKGTPIPKTNPPLSAVSTEMSQLNGNNIFVNVPHLQLDPAGPVATMAHEGIHNITGLTDEDIQSRLHLPSGPSVNISFKLGADCF